MKCFSGIVNCDKCSAMVGRVVYKHTTTIFPHSPQHTVFAALHTCSSYLPAARFSILTNAPGRDALFCFVGCSSCDKLIHIKSVSLCYTLCSTILANKCVQMFI